MEGGDEEEGEATALEAEVVGQGARDIRTGGGGEAQEGGHYDFTRGGGQGEVHGDRSRACKAAEEMRGRRAMSMTPIYCLQSGTNWSNKLFLLF